MRWLVVLLVACGTSAKAPAPAPVEPSGNTMSADTREISSSDVTFTAGTRKVPGTIVAPKAAGKWPAILLLAGSGPTDRDWNSKLIASKNGSGALLATALAQHGAVVLRFDKAGSGANPGPPIAEWTIDTYRDEAAAALALLRSQPNVRADRIFVAGHSEGGIHATRLAALDGKLAGVIYLASASRTMADTMLAQLEAQLMNPAAMLTEKAVEQEMTGLRQAFADFIAGKPVDATKVSRIPQLQQFVAGIVNPATASLSRPLLGFDTAAEAPKLAGPFFVSAGGKDIQIDPERDGKRLATALRNAGKDVTFFLAPDADHVLKHEPKSVEELRANLVAVQNAYNADDRTLDQPLVDALVAWLIARQR